MVPEVWDLRKHVRPLPGADPAALWAHLTGADAGLAFRAVEALAADPAKAVPLVRDRLHAVADFRARVDALVRQLGDDDFQTRERSVAGTRDDRPGRRPCAPPRRNRQPVGGSPAARRPVAQARARRRAARV